jgi:glycine betaine/proline transport system substrate-binding protein
MKKLLTAAAVAGAAVLGMAGQASADAHSCGSMTMAEMNWASAELMANVDKIILEEGYGCEVELVAGATMPTFTSMNEKGEPDVAAELWINAVREPLFKAMDEGRLMSAVEGPITQLGEGWWVPPHTAEKHPKIVNDVNELLARPDLFPHPEDPSKGAFVGCPAGWGCQLANANLFRAFDMEAKGWILVDPGSAAGLDGSMAKAAERGENWLGYYWSPTAMIGKYSMVPVDMGEWGGPENWDGCIVKPEQECANPKPSSWTHSEVHTVVTSEFAGRGGAAVDYLKTRVFPGPIMNSMLVYMADEQAGGADAAIEFLLKHEDLWTKWVSADAAAKIKKSL